MRGYGLPRNDDIASPDKLDLVNYARASHVGRFPSKSGVCKNSFRSSSAKRNQRRVYKRLARNAAKKELRDVEVTY